MTLLGDSLVSERLDDCPNCGISLIGSPIPEKYLHHNVPGDPFYNEREPTCEESKARSNEMAERFGAEYMRDKCHCLPYGEATHWRREIGHDIQGVYDGVLYWSCRDCGWAWHRWTPHAGRRYAEAEIRIQENNRELTNE